MDRRFIFLIVTVSLLCIYAGSQSYTWGFHAHKLIARNAVFTLPQEMIGFYKNNLAILVEASVQPDVRRYVIESEAPNHYIDLELYGNRKDSVLFMKWNEISEYYDYDSLKSMGILPWAIINTYFNLTNAFKQRDPDLIIRYSADLSHYISDAHVPLHTTYNYNGQETGQEGIHRLWESLIPEANSEDYTFWVGRAEYRKYIFDDIRMVISRSHFLVDSVLVIEKELSLNTRKDMKYSFQQRGNSEVRIYSEEYVKSYADLLGNMVEGQMQSAVKTTADFWYTSWIEAGQPELDGISKEIEIIAERKIQGKDSIKANKRTRLH